MFITKKKFNQVLEETKNKAAEEVYAEVRRNEELRELHRKLYDFEKELLELKQLLKESAAAKIENKNLKG